MYKNKVEIEQTYKFINKIINSADSKLIKKILLDNVNRIITKHDNDASVLFYNYLKKGIIKNKNKDILINKQNLNRLFEKSIKIMQYLRMGIRALLKPKNIWNRINLIDKKVILIYAPAYPKYLDFAIPIYEEIKKSSDLTPVLLYFWDKGQFYKSNYTQINLYDYSIGLNKLYKILKELIMTKKEINNEKKYRDFYIAIYKTIWRSQIFNLFRKEIMHNLIRKTNKIKALFCCIPTNDFARAASIIAKEFDIPTFSIIRSAMEITCSELYFVNTKYVLAKGEQEEEMYINMGFDEDKINVVGAPFLKETITKRYAMDKQIKIFFIDFPLTQFCSMNCKRKIISCIGKALKNFPNIKLLVKLHPESIDHENLYIEQFQIIGFSNYKIYKSNYDLSKVLDISDYVIMHGSTVGFNVLFMNKPLIVLSNSFFEIDISIDGEHLFFNERIAFTIRNEQDLQDIFTRISEGKLKRKNYEDIKSFLKYYIKYTGGKAAEQIVRFIESKIDEAEIGGIKKI